MIGRTNVGGGGNWYAYIQVSTDPNAQISVVNLHGDAFSGTADNTGALLLTVTASGTYTVTETGGGTATVVVSDYGVTYSVSVYFFGGYFIRNGLFTAYEMEGLGIWTGGGGVVANMTTTEGVSHTANGETYTCVEIETDSGNNSQCCLVTIGQIDVTDYSTLTMVASASHFDIFGAGLFTKVTDPYTYATLVAGGSMPSYYNQFKTATLDVSGYSGNYYIGVYIGRPSSPRTIYYYVKDLYLE